VCPHELKHQLTLKLYKTKNTILIYFPHGLVPHSSFSSFSHKLICLLLSHAMHINCHIFNTSFCSSLGKINLSPFSYGQ
jgi:hypothetical protein